MKPFVLGVLLALAAACQPATEGQAAPAAPERPDAHAAADAPPSARAAGETAEPAAALVQDSGVETVCFEPEGDCIGVMTAQIDEARDEVLVMAFLFSNRRVINALNRAQDRGVRVRMIVSISREGAGRVLSVQRRGAEVLTRDGLAQHSKYLIIDRRVVVTGSQNFTVSSESNSENTLVIDDPRTVAAYVRNWERRAAGSRPSSGTPRERAEEGES